MMRLAFPLSSSFSTGTHVMPDPNVRALLQPCGGHAVLMCKVHWVLRVAMFEGGMLCGVGQRVGRGGMDGRRRGAGIPTRELSAMIRQRRRQGQLAPLLGCGCVGPTC